MKAESQTSIQNKIFVKKSFRLAKNILKFIF